MIWSKFHIQKIAVKLWNIDRIHSQKQIFHSQKQIFHSQKRTKKPEDPSLGWQRKRDESLEKESNKNLLLEQQDPLTEKNTIGSLEKESNKKSPIGASLEKESNKNLLSGAKCCCTPRSGDHACFLCF